MSRRRGYAAVADLYHDVHHLEVVLQLPLRLGDVPRIPCRMDITSSGDDDGGVGGLWLSRTPGYILRFHTIGSI